MNRLSALAGWLWQAPKPTQARTALYKQNPYAPPPTWMRYTIERWSHEDERAERYAGETYAHTDCCVCHTLYGAFRVGEYVIDDSLSIDFWHVYCAPKRIRWLAVLGLLVCALRAVMGIDKYYRRPS